MSKHYDDKGNQSGWTDANGRHYDDKGNFSGWTDANGRHYDDNGNFSGWTDEKGRHRDDKGNFSGWTDEKGRHRDDKGNFSGWTETSSSNRSSSSSSTYSQSRTSASEGSGGGGDGGVGLALLFFGFYLLIGFIIISPLIIPFIVGGWMIAKETKSENWNKALVISCFVTPIFFIIAYNYVDSFPIVLIPIAFIVYFLMGCISWVFLIKKYDIKRLKFW